MSFNRGARRASLSASPWRASGSAMEALSMPAAAVAKVRNEALRRVVPMQPAPLGSVELGELASVRHQLSADEGMTLDDYFGSGSPGTKKAGAAASPPRPPSER